MQCIEFIASCFTRSPPKTTNKAEPRLAKRDAPEREKDGKRVKERERESCLCREFVAIMPFDIIHNCNQLGNCLADATVPATSSLAGHHHRLRRRRRDVHNHLANCPLWPLLLLLLVAWLPLCVVIINLCARFINDNNESCLILLKSLFGLHIHILHLHLLCYRC